MFNKKEKNFFAKYKGFSFVETIVSIFLITVGLMAVTALISTGLKQSLDSRNQTIAGLLAQEGIEVARNIRDNNWASSNASFDNLPSSDSDDCILDKDSFAIASSDCNKTFDQEILYYSSASGIGFYDKNSSGAQTNFKRKIVVDYDTDSAATAHTVTIASLVSWGSQFPALSNCNTGNKCSYTAITLSKWGEQ